MALQTCNLPCGQGSLQFPLFQATQTSLPFLRADAVVLAGGRWTEEAAGREVCAGVCFGAG
eukprot:2819307-Amphidinium_carterae.1